MLLIYFWKLRIVSFTFSSIFIWELVNQISFHIFLEAFNGHFTISPLFVWEMTVSLLSLLLANFHSGFYRPSVNTLTFVTISFSVQIFLLERHFSGRYRKLEEISIVAISIFTAIYVCPDFTRHLF